MSRCVNVAIVGATGAVGAEFLRLFTERSFPVGELRLLASAKSIGKTAEFDGRTILIEEATEESFNGIDVAFFSAGASRSKALVPVALHAGALVIDNSSAFRADSGIPLVIPEINGELIKKESRLYPVANCSAIILLVAVNPLRKLGHIDRLIVSTYQSASGGGAAVMRELTEQTRAVLAGEGSPPAVLPHPYAFNLFSHNTDVDLENGYNGEELKVISESRKILGMPELKINVTCVRVPVVRAHSESVTVEFAGPAPTRTQVHEVLSQAPGVKVVDDREANHFPMPIEASGQNDVLVGRIRADLSNPNAICMFVSGDQLLKGAALNAVQIAEQYYNVANR